MVFYSLTLIWVHLQGRYSCILYILDDTFLLEVGFVFKFKTHPDWDLCNVELLYQLVYFHPCAKVFGQK
jgi:hypothetical protein